MKILTNKQMDDINFELHDLRIKFMRANKDYCDLKNQLKENGNYIINLIKKLDKTTDELNKTKEKLKLANGRIGGLTKYINRLKDRIDKASQKLEDFRFEISGSDSLEMEEILKGVNNE